MCGHTWLPAEFDTVPKTPRGGRLEAGAWSLLDGPVPLLTLTWVLPQLCSTELRGSFWRLCDPGGWSRGPLDIPVLSVAVIHERAAWQGGETEACVHLRFRNRQRRKSNGTEAFCLLTRWSEHQGQVPGDASRERRPRRGDPTDG